MTVTEKIRAQVALLEEYHELLAELARRGFREHGIGVVVVTWKPGASPGDPGAFTTMQYQSRALHEEGLEAAGVTVLPNAEETYWNFDPERRMRILLVEEGASDIFDMYPFDMSLGQGDPDVQVSPLVQ
jgi:hypothetical protein